MSILKALLLYEKGGKGPKQSISQYSSFCRYDMLLEELVFNQRRVSSEIEIPQSYLAIYSPVSNHSFVLRQCFGSTLLSQM